MKKLFLSFFSIFFLFIIFPKNTHAKRTVPQAVKTATTSTTKKTGSSKGVLVSVRLRADRRAIITTFSDLSNVTKVDYMLSYNTRGTTQGASGSITSPTPGSTTRELLFGTCSHGVCRYDSKITNSQFVVTSYLPSGAKVIKKFRIKV